MDRYVCVKVIDPQGRNTTLQLPLPLAQSLRLREGEVLQGSFPDDRSLLLQRSPAAAEPVVPKGGR